MMRPDRSSTLRVSLERSAESSRRRSERENESFSDASDLSTLRSLSSQGRLLECRSRDSEGLSHDLHARVNGFLVGLECVQHGSRRKFGLGSFVSGVVLASILGQVVYKSMVVPLSHGNDGLHRKTFFSKTSDQPAVVEVPDASVLDEKEALPSCKSPFRVPCDLRGTDLRLVPFRRGL